MKLQRFCQSCGSNMKKNGKRKLKFRGIVQQWICTKCGKYDKREFMKKMWFPRKLVILAVDLYVLGNPADRIVETVYEQYEIWISASTVYVWYLKFSANAPRQEFGNLGKMLHDDDTQIKGKRKGQKFHKFALKCPNTKVMFTYISETKSEETVKEHFKEAKRKFRLSYQPKKIRTDSLPSYHPAISAVFSHEVKHDKFKSFKNHSNNEIENTFREKKYYHRFDKTENAERFEKLVEYRYNFIRKHRTLKKTPAEAAGLMRGCWSRIIKNDLFQHA